MSNKDEVEKKKKHGNIVTTIWAIDAALIMVVLFLCYSFYKRYTWYTATSEPEPMPRDLHFDDFEPIDIDGKIQKCEHFLSYDEIDALLEIVKDSGGWEASPTGGEHYQTPNTDGTFLEKIQHSKLIQQIETRIAKATEIPIHAHEDVLHIAKITTHGKTPRSGHFPPFGLHHDTDTRPWRKKTILIYLTTVPDGGRTIFPLSKPIQKYGILDIKMGKFRPDLRKQLGKEKTGWNRQVTFPLDSEHPYLDLIESSCRGEIGVTVQPVAGTAIMFDHLVDDDSNAPNINLWHAGCNVVGKDEKIILQKFKEKKLHRRKNRYVQKNSKQTDIFQYVSYSPSSVVSNKKMNGKKSTRSKKDQKNRKKKKQSKKRNRKKKRKNKKDDQDTDVGTPITVDYGNINGNINEL